MSTCVTFVCNKDQASSVAVFWENAPDRRIAICLDEGLIPLDEASLIFGEGVEIFGVSELGLSSHTILKEALTLADELFPPDNQSWPARVERWSIECTRHWLIYGVHSARVIEAVLNRFQPQQVLVPEYQPMRLTTRPDEDVDNPLFFDLLPALCRQAGVKIRYVKKAKRGWGLRGIIPLKYVIGQWVSALRRRGSSLPDVQRRPVMVTNLDNDLHRQFDYGKLGQAAELMLAWIKGDDLLVPVEQLLQRVGLPKTTKHAWLFQRTGNLEDIAFPANAQVRPFAGVAYLIQAYRYRRLQRERRSRIKWKGDISWWELLFGKYLPVIHYECSLATAYYLVLEYERARSIIHQCQPQLLIVSDYWASLPQIAAGKELGVKTLTTTSGIGFFTNYFTEYQSDIACVYGWRDKARVLTSCPEAKVILAGDVLLSSRAKSVIPQNKGDSYRVLFVTSARMYGWWFGSLLINYKVYVSALIDCARRLREQDMNIKVMIKSHPLYDLHPLYDRLVAQYSDVFIENRKEPLPQADLEKYDAAVIFSTTTTFIAEVIRASVPMIYFRGGLTELGHEYVDYAGLLHADTVDQVIEQLKGLLAPDGAKFRETALDLGREYLGRYVPADERPLSSVIEEVLGIGSPFLGSNEANWPSVSEDSLNVMDGTRI